MEPLDAFVRVSFAGFAAILLAVAVRSYARHRQRRFLLLAAAFGLFLVEGVWALAGLATSVAPSLDTTWVALNLAVLVSLYLALLR